MYNTANVGISAIINNDKNEILLGLRTSKLGNMKWGLPGGKLEKGESIEKCIIREVEEECNLIVDDLNYLGITNDIFDDGNHFITIYMKPNIIKGELKINEPNKCLEWKYFSYDNLPDNLFLPLKNWMTNKHKYF